MEITWGQLGFVMAMTYLILINLTAFIAFGLDKHYAKRGKWRIPEKRLFLYTALGGSVGAIAGMMVFHHKTQKAKFSIGIPGILGIHCLLICALLILALR